MPYKSEKISIKNTKHDRRVKLTEEQRAEIFKNKDGLSQRKLAAMYEVSRSLIRFILMPEKLLRTKELRALRGGWRQYYDRTKNSQAIREHRAYKQQLFLDNKISLDNNQRQATKKGHDDKS